MPPPNDHARTLTSANGAVVRVGLAYMVTGFLVFLLMGVLGIVMRLRHAGALSVSDDLFYRVMTLHGAGMVVGSLLVAMGGLAAVLSRSVRLSGRGLWGALGVTVLGVGCVIASTLSGGVATGWTVLHPLPFEGKTWTVGAGVVIYLGYLFVALGFLGYALLLLRATVRAHGGLGNALGWRYLFSGGRDTSRPLPQPAELAATAVALDGILAVLAGAVYLVPHFGEAAGLLGRVDLLFAKNLLLVFGHTIANLTIYLAAGLLYATLPVYTAREWKVSWPVVLAWNLVIVLVLVPVFHHLYQDFVQPLPLAILGQAGSYAVGLPAALVTILGALALVYGSQYRWTVAAILMALGLWGWVVGGIAAVLDSTIAVNQVMHNTLWVPAHFHTYYLLGAVSFGVAYMYHLLGELSGSGETALSRAAAWLYGVGTAGFVLMFYISGANSVPRRYAVHLPEWQGYARLALPFVILLALAIGWLTFEMGRRLGPPLRRTKA
jgi:cytochrome c oxidase subunit 1